MKGGSIYRDLKVKIHKKVLKNRGLVIGVWSSGIVANFSKLCYTTNHMQAQLTVKKAVILAAGLGTRFLPITKAVPKELLPIGSQPALHYLVEEMADSGIKEVILVISPEKQAIKKYFSRDLKLEKFLKSKGKYQALAPLVELLKKIKISYVYQKQALGNGHALLCAKKQVGNEPFILSDADSIIAGGQEPAVKQLLRVFEKVKAPVIGVQRIADRQEMVKYGNVYVKKSKIKNLPRTGSRLRSGKKLKIYEVERFFEKPALNDVSKQGLIIGGMRYVLTHEIWKELENTKKGRAGEIWFLDAANALARKTDFYAYEYEGKYFDTGSPESLLKTMIIFAEKYEP